MNKIALLLITVFCIIGANCTYQPVEIKPGEQTAVYVDAPAVAAISPTNNIRPTWYWSIPEHTVKFRYRLNNNAWTVTDTVVEKTYRPDYYLAEGEYVLEVQAMSRSGQWSESGIGTIVIDIDPPATPDVSGDTPTADLRPTWTWSVPADAVLMRYALDGAQWTVTDSIENTAYTPAEALMEGEHTLAVQAMDGVGNWSAAGEWTVDIDLTKPAPPVVSVVSPTNNRRPVWTWDMSDDCRDVSYRLNDGDWITTGDPAVNTFAPDMPLFEGTYILEVRVQNALGIWSDPAQSTAVIDLTPPDAPYVTGDTQTNDTTPTWSWLVPEGTNNSRYRINYGEWQITNNPGKTGYTPAYPLAGGVYILELQVQDGAGNWSVSGKKTISIDLIPPDMPEVTGLTTTIDPMPTWTWDVPLYTEYFRYRLDKGVWVTTPDASVTAFTPDKPLTVGTHILEVQAVDKVGNYSLVGNCTIKIQ